MVDAATTTAPVDGAHASGPDQLIVVSGMSGSGKTVALRTLRGGMQVQVVRTPNGAARVVLVLAGAGA